MVFIKNKKRFVSLRHILVCNCRQGHFYRERKFFRIASPRIADFPFEGVANLVSTGGLQLSVGNLDGQGVVAEGVHVLPGLVPQLDPHRVFLALLLGAQHLNVKSCDIFVHNFLVQKENTVVEFERLHFHCVVLKT